MEAPLTVLYSHAIRGDLNLLPRLYRFLSTLRAQATGTVLLVDLGQSCDPEVWPCDVTEGRSTLLVLDAMGYHAANVSGQLSEASRARLAGQVTLALVDADHSHTHEGMILTVRGRPGGGGRPYGREAPLQIVLAPGEETALQDGVLILAAVSAGEIGVARVDGDAVQAEVRTLPAATTPDPTIAGVVDLVVEEARYFQDHR